MNVKIIFIALLIYLISSCTHKRKSEPPTPADSTKIETSSANDSFEIEEQSIPDERKGSIKTIAVSTLGKAQIKINYYSPAVRGRIIWGGLVPLDKVWVTGAHSATSIEFDQDMIIANEVVAAGKYAFFTIPGKDTWTIILNQDWRQHLTDRYDEKKDVLRVSVKPEVEDKNQERLRYVIEKDSDTQGEIVMYWEKIEISLPFTIK